MPVVNPASFGNEGSESPETQAFVVQMYAAWKDWVANGAIGVSKCGGSTAPLSFVVLAVVATGTSNILTLGSPVTILSLLFVWSPCPYLYQQNTTSDNVRHTPIHATPDDHTTNLIDATTTFFPLYSLALFHMLSAPAGLTFFILKLSYL